MASSLADLYVDLSLRNEKFTRGLEESAAAGEAFGEKYSKASKDAQDASKKLADQEKETADAADRSTSAWSRLTEKLRGLRSEMTSHGGLLSRLLFGSGGSGDAGKDLDDASSKLGGLFGLFQKLDSLGGEGAGKIPMLGDMLGEGGPGSLVALLGVAAAASAALVEVTGLVSGFAAAGAGAGAFALLAVPAFDKVKTAYTAINTAQAAYHKAQLTEQMDPTKSNAAAVAKALLNLKESYKGLDPAERGAVRGIQQLMNTYHRMSKAFEPDAFKVFNTGLKIANKLLPDVTPFAHTFANAIDGLLTKVSKFAGSKGFKDWLDQFHKLEGPSITAIGTGIGKVATAFGKLLTTMSKKDVVNAINIAFSILSGTISFLTGWVQRSMWAWDLMSKEFRDVRHDVADLGHDVATWFDRMRHDVAEFAHNFATEFDQVRGDIARWVTDIGRDLTAVANWFWSLPGKIGHALASLPSMLFSVGKSAVEGFINGLKSMLGPIGSAGEDIGHAFLGAVKDVLGIFSPSKVMYDIGLNINKGLIQGLEGSASQVKSSASKLATDVKSAFNAGLISQGAASVLTSFIQRDNTRLQKLANDRSKILKEIAAAKAYATSTAQAAEQQYGVVNAAGGGSSPATAASILATLRTNLTSIRQFKANIQKLAKMGLNKAYINQIIQAGPVDGGQIAAELASGSWSQIQQINSVEKQITSASTSLGKTAANAMYDSGKDAGRGFLSGLEHQQKSIEDVMKRIAKAMVSTIRKELGISSPSTVMRQHGRDAARGFALGIEDGIAGTTAASARLAGALSGGAHGGSSGGGSQVTNNFHLTVQGYVGNEEQLAEKLLPPLQKVILEVNRANPGTGNGLSLGTAAGRAS